MTLDSERLPDYYEALRELDDLMDKKRPFIGLKKTLHPVIYGSIVCTRLSRDQELIIINKDQRKIYADDTIIYAFTHVGRYDVEIITEIIKKPYCLIAGDPEVMYRTPDGFAMLCNGVEYVNTDSKSDRKVCFHNMVRNLKQEMSVVIAPEGIWNASRKFKNSSKPCLDIYDGAIDAAFITEKDIGIIGIEQYGNQFIAYIGERFNIKKYKYGYKDQELAKEEAKLELRDRLATAKWCVWEYKSQISGIEKRTDIPDNYWDGYVNNRIAEWTDKNGKPYYDDKIIESRIYQRKDEIDEDEVYSFIDEKFKPKLNNVFLLRKHYNKHDKIER